jgi:hypothetical protein
MDIRIHVFGTIELDDPVDFGKVEASGGDIGGKENGVLGGDEAGIDFEPLRLLLLAVQVQQRYTRPEMAERLKDVPNLLARGEEHEGLVGEMRL